MWKNKRDEIQIAIGNESSLFSQDAKASKTVFPLQKQQKSKVALDEEGKKNIWSYRDIIVSKGKDQNTC